MDDRPMVIHIDRSQRGETVAVPPGRLVELTLPENPTTGHLWEFVSLPGGWTVTNEEFAEHPEGAPGAAGVHTWFLEPGDGPGGEISMVCRQPWEPDAASDRFTVSVVRDDG